MRHVLLFVVCFVLLFSVTAISEEYRIVGWNDLGMHCSNYDFSKIVVLPPYNVVRAHVIKVGDANHLPTLVTDGIEVTYEIPGNTYSVGKTNFWDYEDKLFGVNLEPNIGLTGEGLSGKMSVHENYFHVDGIPLTPYTDADLKHEDPYQLALLTLHKDGKVLATTKPVVPVSNEINCVSSGCHTSEEQIMDLHGDQGGFDKSKTPILCASCHSSNALGTKGQPGTSSLSQAMHKFHGDKTNDCAKCHPGPMTRCLRGVMATDYELVCQDCHGTVSEVGMSIVNGRQPWLNEPSCGNESCHGAKYAEEPGKLFRESKGHGELFCSTCHGSPHAIAPSREKRDNVQFTALQGHAGTLNTCSVCHGVTPSGEGPHGVMATASHDE